jgi:DNA-binding transcriptional MocR family regulator
VAKESLVLTSGATSGLWLTATLFLRRSKPVVFVEKPTYFLATDVLAGDLGLDLIGVDMDEEGMKADQLEAKISQERLKRGQDGDEDGRFWALLYLVPTFHNPTGSCTSETRARQLVAVARRHRVLVVCDDVYNLLHYGPSPPQRLLAFDQDTPDA